MSHLQASLWSWEVAVIHEKQQNPATRVAKWRDGICSLS